MQNFGRFYATFYTLSTINVNLSRFCRSRFWRSRLWRFRFWLSRFCRVTDQKTQPTVSKYWRNKQNEWPWPLYTSRTRSCQPWTSLANSKRHKRVNVTFAVEYLGNRWVASASPRADTQYHFSRPTARHRGIYLGVGNVKYLGCIAPISQVESEAMAYEWLDVINRKGEIWLHLKVTRLVR